MDISAQAEGLVKKYGTRDPFELSRALGAEVVFSDLGSIKGMYTVIKRNRFIVINPSLPERMQRIVCAHELGHDRLHRGIAMDTAFRELALYDMTLRPEYEANLFAASLLIGRNELLTAVRSGGDSSSVAALLDTDVNLLIIRARELVRCGEKLEVPPARVDFLAGKDRSDQRKV